ncbi:hypothetical protein, partial [Methanoculleus sp. MH98A]|uniref:hypothetical protein n=1 Tax=Methanoculleus sp. MH98A TaxID=1495314 RepID=UPI001E4FDC4B
LPAVFRDREDRFEIILKRGRKHATISFTSTSLWIWVALSGSGAIRGEPCHVVAVIELSAGRKTNGLKAAQSGILSKPTGILF